MIKHDPVLLDLHTMDTYVDAYSRLGRPILAVMEMGCPSDTAPQWAAIFESHPYVIKAKYQLVLKLRAEMERAKKERAKKERTRLFEMETMVRSAIAHLCSSESKEDQIEGCKLGIVYLSLKQQNARIKKPH